MNSKRSRKDAFTARFRAITIHRLTCTQAGKKALLFTLESFCALLDEFQFSLEVGLLNRYSGSQCASIVWLSQTKNSRMVKSVRTPMNIAKFDDFSTILFVILLYTLKVISDFNGFLERTVFFLPTVPMKCPAATAPAICTATTWSCRIVKSKNPLPFYWKMSFHSSRRFSRTHIFQKKIYTLYYSVNCPIILQLTILSFLEMWCFHGITFKPAK